MSHAYLAIAASVLMHVCWNVLARHVNPKANFLWWGILAHLLLIGPWAIWRFSQDARWHSHLLIALVVTAGANAFYFMALRQSYRYAPVALVYPIARSSPLLIVIWAWWLFDQPVESGALMGIVVSVAGLLVLAHTAAGNRGRRALPWALLAALGTSVYSLSDQVAVRYLPSFGAQLGFVTLSYAVAFIVLSLLQYRETGRCYPAVRPPIAWMLLGGACIGVAYALVVRALLYIPAAYAVTYTNGGIVLATLLSLTVFKERRHWQQRLVGACIVTLGLFLLSGYAPH